MATLCELGTDKTQSAWHAKRIAEKVRLALSEPYLLTLNKEGQAESTVGHNCSVSIGVVLFVFMKKMPAPLRNCEPPDLSLRAPLRHCERSATIQDLMDCRGLRPRSDEGKWRPRSDEGIVVPMR